MLTYAQIKDLAKEYDMRVTDLIALSPKNDPFYAGTPADVRNAQWFAEIWKRAGYDVSGAHLRKVHYWTLSHSDQAFTRLPDGSPYENSLRCWDFLTQSSKIARYLGLVDIEKVFDNKNPPPQVNAWYSFYDYVYHEIEVPNLEDIEVKLYGASVAMAQPYHLEIWIEKSTMNNVLLPVCERFRANLNSFEGEVSITSCKKYIERVERADWKPAVIFYISDFDPAGNSMPVATARKIEYMLHKYGHIDHADIVVKPIALTQEQVAEFDLPRIPIKETELRAGKFEAAFGSGAVELDALEALYPGELERIVTEAMEPYYSEEAERHAYKVANDRKRDAEAKVQEILKDNADDLEAAKRLLQKIKDIDLDDDDYMVERFDPHVEKDDEALFDSTRSYTDQIPYYKRHKGQESVLA